jgi:hypothetical protein
LISGEKAICDLSICLKGRFHFLAIQITSFSSMPFLALLSCTILSTPSITILEPTYLLCALADLEDFLNIAFHIDNLSLSLSLSSFSIEYTIDTTKTGWTELSLANPISESFDFTAQLSRDQLNPSESPRHAALFCVSEASAYSLPVAF